MSGLTIQSVLTSPNVPSLPTVALRVIELARDENVDLGEIAHVIEVDQGITAKVMRTINSSFYALSRPCTSVRQALAYLGLNTVKTIVLGFSLVETVAARADDGFDYMAYWRRGVLTACAAREIAQATLATDPEEAFLAAVLHDIGMICLLRALDDDYVRVVRRCDGHDDLPALEREAFGLDHADVGAAQVEAWNLTGDVTDAIRGHHRDDLSRVASPIARVLLLARRAATAVEGPGESAWAACKRDAAAVFGLDETACRLLLERITSGAEQLSSLLHVEIGTLPPITSILEEAEVALLAHQTRLQEETQALRASNEALSRLALTDPLTGLRNRQHFDDVLAATFEAAREQGGCLGLAFLDVDHFKTVNDTHGHQAGDAVLVAIARTLADATGDRGVVCRYGGEEFAVILPGADRVEATRYTERLRRLVESLDLHAEAESAPSGTRLPPSTTISAGVVAYEPALAGAIVRPEQLTAIADSAVYAAKSAGRNCVRVFAAPAAAAAA